jgi:hypothetical protein
MRRGFLLFNVLVIAACGQSSSNKNNAVGDGGTPPIGDGGGAQPTPDGGTQPAQEGGATSDGGTLCGNGKVDPGEKCDGSTLDGGTCTSLGFESGTLECAPSCQFDTTSCVGTFTTTVVASRTTCAAPCGVSFDATTTAGLASGDYVGANFNWDFDSTNVDPNGLHEKTIGFVTAHVFEVPGTYQIAVRVEDVAGHASSTTVPITVTAMTGPTIYVASSGSDGNDGTSMTTPMATLAAALARYTAPQTSILLQRGDTFDLGSSTVTLSSTGPFLIGAYGSSLAATPILTSGAYADYAAIFVLQGVSDFRLTDVHLEVTAAGTNNTGIAIEPAADHTLLERVELEGVGEGTDGAGEGIFLMSPVTSTFVVDCHLHDFNGDGIYADRPTAFAMIGTTIEKFGGTNHGVRVQGGSVPGNTGFATNTYMAENMIAPNPNHAASFDATAIRGDNTNTVYVDNHVERVVGVTPTADTELEHISNVLLEGNIFADNEGPDMAYTSIGIIAQHVVVRNNVMINPDNAIQISGNPLLPAHYVDQIEIYNNTVYMFPAAGVDNTYTINFLAHTSGAAAGTVTMRNNIWTEGMTSADSSYVFSDGMGTEIEDHNLGFAPNVSGTWGGAPASAGDVVGDPKFASTDPTNASAFQLSTGSAAIDVGTMLPVYQDLAGTPRPQGPNWDMGAFEFAQ